MKQYPLIGKCLVVGIILLFIGTGIIPAIAQESEKPSQSTSRGNWLYVGGSGPGNYSSIQAAINATSSGDTVFVYAASSPYYENVIINKSINLIGENRNTTIIDGKKIDDPIWIKASFVTVSDFTISNGSTENLQAGIHIIEKKWYHPDNPPCRLTNIHIANCIIKNNRCGIWLVNTYTVNISSCRIHNNPSHSIYLCPSSHVSINNCEITDNGDIYPGGIVVGKDSMNGIISQNITVSNCSLSNNIWAGIWITDSARNIEICHNNIFENTHVGIIVSASNAKIYDNHIYDNGVGGFFFDGGVFLQDCINNVTVNDNTIETNNQYGLYLLRSSANSVKKNNFIHNKCNAFFSGFSFFNHWNGNYWTDWAGIGPKLIKGKLGEELIPWVNFDWRPAQEPYDIPGTK
ncbi:MAG: right-handed parallel beta-helix repeat-containing protein [Thermoplasmata archaeon]|nr:right-handed parallel beta-helix repeat-containing protein [Thermoplasmata archaeon]